MPDDSSHPSTVSFLGEPLGKLLAIRVASHQAEIEDREWYASYLEGIGENWRILRLAYCYVVTPGSVSLSFLGAPPFTMDDVGATGTLSVTAGASGFSQEAILENWEIDAVVGELVRGSARFRLTGR